MAEPLVPFSQQHPILKQALDDARRLSWQQVGVPVLGALANLAVTGYRDYLANRLDLSLSLRNLFWSLVIGLVLYVIVAIVRAPFVIVGRHHQQLSEVQQRLLSTETGLLGLKALPAASTPTPPKPEPPPEPNVIYQSSGVVDAHRKHRGFIYEGKDFRVGGGGESFLALIVTYRNTILRDRQIGGRGNVSAKISFILYQAEGLPTANRAAWLSTDEFRVTFGINDPHSLIVAIYEKGQLSAVQENPKDYDNAVRKVDLTGNLHGVYIDLISESESKILSSTDLMLEVARDPFKLTLERTKTWKRRKLTELAQSGRDLMDRCKAAEDDAPFEQEFQEWEAKAAAFVRRHLGDSFNARFRPAPYKPPPNTSRAFQRIGKALEPVGVYDKTRVKVETLERFKDEDI